MTSNNTPIRLENSGPRRGSPLQRVRSYLNDELVTRFELSGRFRAPSTASPEQRSPSNFVRRLVASLERRGKDSSPIGRALASANLPTPGSPGPGTFIHSGGSWRRSSCGIEGEVSRRCNEAFGVKADGRPKSCRNTLGKSTSLRTKLENVYEESSAPSESPASSVCGNSDDEELIPITRESNSQTTKSPKSTISTSANNPTTSIPIIASTARILKNFLSTIVTSWKSKSPTQTPSPKTTSKNNIKNRLLQLPRGLRNNQLLNKINSKDCNNDITIADRPSLGDELHVFRRDTMPRLMNRYERRKRAAGGRIKNFASSPDLMRLGNRQKGGNGKELENSFDRLLLRSRTSALIHEEMGDGCVATVKPRRRSKCDGQNLIMMKQQQRFSLDLDGVRVKDDDWDEDLQKWQEGSVMSLAVTRAQPVQVPVPPTLPPMAPRMTNTNEIREADYAEINHQLIGRAKGPNENDPLYDVPRRLAPPPQAYHTVQLRIGQPPPRYENVGFGGNRSENNEIITTGEETSQMDDQRLQCTAFTTF
ncbi:hypothetical protein QAD02_011214 [Eretmocerus hayati]|uniref:Uncharacterized protein n=1 Tax=Eretmocerus hayati TaxID=131215 RepID=A0ACC2NW44_9HYME|nr:hypothetical protein QAD02_011214 [Eretmocerus hayati]